MFPEELGVAHHFMHAGVVFPLGLFGGQAPPDFRFLHQFYFDVFLVLPVALPPHHGGILLILLLPSFRTLLAAFELLLQLHHGLFLAVPLQLLVGESDVALDLILLDVFAHEDMGQGLGFSFFLMGGFGLLMGVEVAAAPALGMVVHFITKFINYISSKCKRKKTLKLS